jgi:hypothetical protein
LNQGYDSDVISYWEEKYIVNNMKAGLYMGKMVLSFVSFSRSLVPKYGFSGS